MTHQSTDSWNSVVFSVTAATNVAFLNVGPTFLQPQRLNLTALHICANYTDHHDYDYGYDPPDYNLMYSLHQAALSGNLTNLTSAECIRNYGINSFESDWGNVLLVSVSPDGIDLQNVHVHDGGGIYHFREGEYQQTDDLHWFCIDDDYDESCDIKSLVANADNWKIAALRRASCFTRITLMTVP